MNTLLSRVGFDPHGADGPACGYAFGFIVSVWGA